jgi:hypothetical protein
MEREREIGLDEKVRIVEWRSGEFYRGFVRFGRDEGAISIVRGDGQSRRKRLRPPSCKKGRPSTPPAHEVELAGSGEGGAMSSLMRTANCLECLAVGLSVRPSVRFVRHVR